MTRLSRPITEVISDTWFGGKVSLSQKTCGFPVKICNNWTRPLRKYQNRFDPYSMGSSSSHSGRVDVEQCQDRGSWLIYDLYLSPMFVSL